MMEEAQGWQRVPGKWQGVVAPQGEGSRNLKTSSGEFGELGEEEIRIAKEDSMRLEAERLEQEKQERERLEKKRVEVERRKRENRERERKRWLLYDEYKRHERWAIRAGKDMDQWWEENEHRLSNPANGFDSGSDSGYEI
jgi:hypothetical protein